MSDVPFSTLRMDESVTVCFLRMSGNSGDMGSIAVGKWRAPLHTVVDGALYMQHLANDAHGIRTCRGIDGKAHKFTVQVA